MEKQGAGGASASTGNTRDAGPGECDTDPELKELLQWARSGLAAGEALINLVRRGVTPGGDEPAAAPRGWKALALLRDVKALRREAPSKLPDLRGVPGIPADSALPRLLAWEGFQAQVTGGSGFDDRAAHQGQDV